MTQPKHPLVKAIATELETNRVKLSAQRRLTEKYKGMMREYRDKARQYQREILQLRKEKK